MNEPRTPETAEDFGISLVSDDFMFRLQRRIGLARANGLGIVRRAAFWSLFGWVSIALWAWSMARALSSAVTEPLFAHFGIQLRSLVAIPLFIVAEGLAQGLTTRRPPHFVRPGLVPPNAPPRFAAAIADTGRLRGASLPWMAIFAIVVAIITPTQVTRELHEVSWTVVGEGPVRHIGFSGWWFIYVRRPIFLTLLLAWLWRGVLLFVLFGRIAKLPLSIVPTHPDRTGGFGFLGRFPAMFAPVVLAIGSMLASGWAHDVVYHGAHVTSLRGEMAAFVAVSPAVFPSPLLVIAPLLSHAKKPALLQYDTLIGRHGRLVREKWIEGKDVKDVAVLDGTELGPVADTVAMYDAVSQTRPVRLSKSSVAPLVLAIEVPVIELPKKLLPSLI